MRFNQPQYLERLLSHIPSHIRKKFKKPKTIKQVQDYYQKQIDQLRRIEREANLKKGILKSQKEEENYRNGASIIRSKLLKKFHPELFNKTHFKASISFYLKVCFLDFGSLFLLNSIRIRLGSCIKRIQYKGQRRTKVSKLKGLVSIFL